MGHFFRRLTRGMPICLDDCWDLYSWWNFFVHLTLTLICSCIKQIMSFPTLERRNECFIGNEICHSNYHFHIWRQFSTCIHGSSLVYFNFSYLWTNLSSFGSVNPWSLTCSYDATCHLSRSPERSLIHLKVRVASCRNTGLHLIITEGDNYSMFHLHHVPR